MAVAIMRSPTFGCNKRLILLVRAVSYAMGQRWNLLPATGSLNKKGVPAQRWLIREIWIIILMSFAAETRRRGAGAVTYGNLLHATC